MALDRRAVLKALATAGAAVAGTASNAAAFGRPPRAADPNTVGLLYDATRCIGCKSCVAACYEANFEARPPGELFYDPVDLSSSCKNVIKHSEGTPASYVKMQCMHCVDPACASACMLRALEKQENGIVTWDGGRCVGCRYCQVACPYNVPKFEWYVATPEIVKCELCHERVAAGEEPACAAVCPMDAVVFGKRGELLAEAHARIAAAPERYEPKVFGEHDGGGTQVLYLSKAGVSFTQLGLPELGEESTARLAEKVQHTIYRGFIAPLALYALLAPVVWKRHRQHDAEEVDE